MEKAETIDTAMPEEMIKRQPDTDYGELVKIEYGSHLTTKLRRAQVLLPPEYGKEKEYPVVYLLHELEEMRRNGFLDIRRKLSEI